MKETPMEDVLRDVLADEPLTYEELEEAIHEKTQEAIRLLRAKGELTTGQRVDSATRKVMQV